LIRPEGYAQIGSDVEAFFWQSAVTVYGVAPFCFAPLPLFEIARVLVRLNHVARFIVNANHGRTLVLLAIPTSSKRSSTRRREKTKRERKQLALRTLNLEF